jgi:outer membrane lipoprotein SlyB
MPPPLKEMDLFKVWILVAICGAIGGLVAGGVLGAVIGGVLNALGVSLDTIRLTAKIAGGIAGLAISYVCFRFFVMRIVVRKLSPASDDVSV